MCIYALIWMKIAFLRLEYTFIPAKFQHEINSGLHQNV